jgi:hypothetical protein
MGEYMTDKDIFVAGSKEKAEESIKELNQQKLPDINIKVEEILTLVDSIALSGSSFDSAVLSGKIVKLTEELKKHTGVIQPGPKEEQE